MHCQKCCVPADTYTSILLLSYPWPFQLQPGQPHTAVQHSYEGERITWVPCGEVTEHPLECSNMTIPMEHFAPPDLTRAEEQDDHIPVFTIPLIRMRSRTATESILINPGRARR